MFTPEDEEKVKVQFKWIAGEAERKIDDLILKKRAEGQNLN